MTFTPADEAEVLALRAELAADATEINPDLSSANLWLWSFTPRESDPRDVLNTVFKTCELPSTRGARQNVELWPWAVLTTQQAREAATRYLFIGECMESPAFHDEQAAQSFADRVLGWIGHPLSAFSNFTRRPDGSGMGFWVFAPHGYSDGGLVLVGPERVGVLWFVGTD